MGAAILPSTELDHRLLSGFGQLYERRPAALGASDDLSGNALAGGMFLAVKSVGAYVVESRAHSGERT
ncbi:hypothetical protein MTX26_32065 [Bradyrhizobium sp. ISRA443]|uniref:hypothetical protein n=1 Tax=unclassified Bradyrhizobium TaxID=2631580 RepID=UPI00247B28E3|nr:MULTISPECIES: hypothetical protein [unclassified Bradyrhizobium]WGR98786.1 hypothetical protein MTX23_32045 [Bradyrhizobium sp. ISRA436]WGS05677.1 hypothetical protein MTX18_32065 [Bradyrhizobium sp. ISRA437]WGS12563.1 hypothetical protein MTX26_32065 [Bradyrhizobium sp. ISRA443]